MTDTPRSPSDLDRLVDAFVDDWAALEPCDATAMGVAGHDERLTDYSADGARARADLVRDALARAEALPLADDVDQVTLAAFADRGRLALERSEAGLDVGDLDVIASPLQGLREVFDLMPTTTDDDWAVLTTRLRAVPTALAQYRAGVDEAVRRGHPPTARAVRGGAGQAEEFASPSGSFALLAAQAPEARAEEVRSAAADAAEAYADLAAWLRSDVADHARAEDAVGRDAYALHSRYYTGTTLDLEETYAWGVEESRRVWAEMEDVAGQVLPGGGVAEAVAALDADPEGRIDGAEAFRAWMQRTSDQALEDLADVHFDIPQQVRVLECRIAPSHSGGIYYTPPSEDLSRPGAMWWAVPEGIDSFSTWREATTVYHEGIPGHHLQIAQTLVRAEVLNRWRRVMCWSSGYGEGWALYAERLMDELGYLDTPARRMGMLDGQSLRAARVVVDLGVHCRFEAPEEVGGGAWDEDKAWRFLRSRTLGEDAVLRFELDRYLTWPGQAPSYKVGERAWRDLRAEAARREGDAFDLKAFHRRALDLGSLPLDVLREAVLGH